MRRSVVSTVWRRKVAHRLRGGAAPALGPGKMRRELRHGIAKSFVDLALREVARLFEVRAREIGPAEPRACEIGAFEERLAQFRPAQIGAVETRIAGGA